MDAFFAELISICKPLEVGFAQRSFLHGISTMIGVQLTVSDAHHTRIVTGQKQSDPNYSRQDLSDLVTFQRRWCASTRPYVGVTCSGTLVLSGVPLRPGDIVTELPGSTYPMLLTPVRNQKHLATGKATQYKIIGECVLYQNEHAWDRNWQHLIPREFSTHRSFSKTLFGPSGNDEQPVARNRFKPRRHT